jgi:hypothetical protein
MSARVSILLALGWISCTEANPDYVMPGGGACALGARQCSGARPVACLPGGDGGAVWRNELCPSAGECSPAEGRCIPPMDAARCRREADCAAGQTCTGFVDLTGGGTGAIATFCVAWEGQSPGAVSCGAPHECRSNLCLATMSNVVKEECFLACQADGDCPPTMKCRNYMVTITGVQGTIKGCGPR